MANEPEVIANWLRAALVASSGVVSVFGQRIYPDMVPPKVVIPIGTPYITYNQQSDVSIHVLPIARLGVNDLWSVQCWIEGAESGTGSHVAINAGYDAVDAALHGKAGTAAGGRVLVCYREQVLRSTEESEGRYWRRIIGLYRIQGRVE
jgi:hypothetical protein